MEGMREVKLSQAAPAIIEQLVNGAFLTVSDGQRTNVMTIGWGTVGRIWSKPIMMVPVRFSRYTKQIIDSATSFTVSVPAHGDMAEALACCGTTSGRDGDKFAGCAVRQLTATEVDSPAIGGCEFIVECRIVHRQTLEPLNLDQAIKDQSYQDYDYHVMYYGEALKVWAKA